MSVEVLQVMCINNKHMRDGFDNADLTEGKVYDVKLQESNGYRVIDDTGHERGYLKGRFKEVGTDMILNGVIRVSIKDKFYTFPIKVSTENPDNALQYFKDAYKQVLARFKEAYPDATDKKGDMPKKVIKENDLWDVIDDNISDLPRGILNMSHTPTTPARTAVEQLVSRAQEIYGTPVVAPPVPAPAVYDFANTSAPLTVPAPIRRTTRRRTQA